MKTALVFAVLQCFLLINCLQQLASAVPPSRANEDVVAVSSDDKRGAEYRNALFGVYVCHVKKATEAVTDKIEVKHVSN